VAQYFEAAQYCEGALPLTSITLPLACAASNVTNRLIAINALSLICGVTANICIILMKESIAKGRQNYNRRLIEVSIICGEMASMLLIAIISAASQLPQTRVRHEAAFTGAFYSAVVSAVLYFLISALLIYTGFFFDWRSICGSHTPNRKLIAFR
jgi:hypothetical protein